MALVSGVDYIDRLQDSDGGTTLPMVQGVHAVKSEDAGEWASNSNI